MGNILCQVLLSHGERGRTERVQELQNTHNPLVGGDGHREERVGDVIEPLVESRLVLG